MSKERNLSLDVIRIIAVFAIVMIHCSGVFVSGYATNTAEFLWGNLFDSLSRIGVPFFLMVSGALMLEENKKISLKDLFCRYLKNIFLITLAWSTVYAAVYHCIIPLLNNKPVNVKNILQSIVTGHYHMWYLYMFMGIFLALPFLKSFVRKENKNMVLLFLSVSLAIQFTAPLLEVLKGRYSVFEYGSSLIDDFHLDFFAGYVSYYLAGWYIVHVGIQKRWIRYIAYSLSILALAGIVLYTQLTKDYSTVYENVSLPVFLYSFGAFLVLTRIPIIEGEKKKNVITTLSKLTFGVYIVHVMAITLYERIFPYDKNPFLYILAFFGIVVGTSFGVSFILSKIPIVKKIVRM